MAWTLVETYTVGSGGVANFTISNIPQTGKDLLVLWSARSETTNFFIDFIPNSTGYSGDEHSLVAFGSSISSGGFNPRMVISTYTANNFTNGSVLFPNYTSSNKKVSAHENTVENNSTSKYLQLGTMTQDTTSAITSLYIRGNGGQDIAQYSTFSLYIIS